MKINFDYGDDDIFDDMSSDDQQNIEDKDSQKIMKEFQILQQKKQNQNKDKDDMKKKEQLEDNDLDYLLPQRETKESESIQLPKKQNIRTKQKNAQIIKEEQQVKKKLKDIYERRNKKIAKIQKKINAVMSYQVLKQGSKFFALRKFQKIQNEYFFIQGIKYAQFCSLSDIDLIEEKINQQNDDDKLDLITQITFEQKLIQSNEERLQYFFFLLKLAKIEFKILYFLQIENLGYKKRFKLKIPKTFKVNEKKISKKFRHSKKSHAQRKKICKLLNEMKVYILIGNDCSNYKLPIFNGGYTDTISKDENQSIQYLKNQSKGYSYSVLDFELIEDKNLQRTHNDYFCYNLVPQILRKLRNKVLFGVFLIEQKKKKLQISQVTRIVLPEIVWAQMFMNQKTMKIYEFFNIVCKDNKYLPIYYQHIDEQLQQLREPQSNFEFKVSKKYIVKNALSNNQFLKDDAEPAPFTFKGQQVYYKKDILQLYTEVGWKKQGRIVKEDEQPTKSVPNQYLKSGICKYYKKDQTKEYVLEIKDGQLPSNEYGNIELYACKLPEELVHLKEKGMWRVCKRLKIDYKKAITGFDVKKGRNVVVSDGIVVFKKYQDQLLQEWELMQDEIQAKEKIKNEKKVLEYWRKLFKTILVKRYFNKQLPQY